MLKVNKNFPIYYLIVMYVVRMVILKNMFKNTTMLEQSLLVLIFIWFSVSLHDSS